MFIVALFIITKKWKQPKYPLAHKWINKMWHIHKKECYSATKRNSTTWKNLEKIMLMDLTLLYKMESVHLKASLASGLALILISAIVAFMTVKELRKI